MVYHTAGYHNVDPAVFLDMTLVEMATYVEGVFEDKENTAKYEFLASDRLNHYLGQYIAIATHDPKKYPKTPFLDDQVPKEETKQEMTPEQMKVALLGWMGVLGGEEVTYGK